MSIGLVTSRALAGIDAPAVRIEVFLSGGLPSFSVSGMAETAARIEKDMDPMRAASVMDTDEVVPVADLRAWLCCLVEAAWQGTGYRRTKNPRIWSLHDLEVLGRGPATIVRVTVDAPGEIDVDRILGRG